MYSKIDVGKCVAADDGINVTVLSKSVTYIYYSYSNTLVKVICSRSRSINGFTVSSVNKLSAYDPI